MNDEAKAEARKMSMASTFDRLVESNLQLVKTVRAAILVVAACAVASMSWSTYATYSMRGTLVELRVMVQHVLENVAPPPSSKGSR